MSDDDNNLSSGLNASMEIYPNPSRGIVNIEITSLSGLKGELSIINSKGQLLKSIEIDELSVNETRTLRVDLSDFPGNLFFATYNDGLGRSSKKITKF